MERKKDFKQFAESMRLLEATTGKDISTERVEIYFKFLEDLEIDDLARAIHRLVKTEQYPTFPTIGKIRSLIEGDADDKIDLKAQVAWAKASDLVWHLGDTGESSGDALLDEVVTVAFGGWRGFGATNVEFEGPDRRRFLDCYKTIAARERRIAIARSKPPDQLGE